MTMIKSRFRMADGTERMVQVMPSHVVFFWRDDFTGLVEMRLMDGSQVSTDLRLARVQELVEGAAGIKSQA